MKKTSGYCRRGPDLVTEELASVLSRKTSFEFKPFFDIVHANLRARNAASGGEEMLRLRAYEKLQTLVQGGVVKKDGKRYKGVPAALATYIQQMNEAAIPVVRPPSVSPTATKAAVAAN